MDFQCGVCKGLGCKTCGGRGGFNRDENPVIGIKRGFDALIAERDAALARAEKAEAELSEVLDYAGHRAGCLAEVYAAGEPGPCTCGWDAMRKRHGEGKDEAAIAAVADWAGKA